MAVDAVHDALTTAAFLPSGGGRVRRSLVDALDVRSSHRVLELGCGTGQVTALLVESGAEVIAVDTLPEMLVGARQRAPGATLLLADALELDVGGAFDRVVLSFVLHGLDADARVRLLRRAREAAASDGQVGVLDWAQPSGRIKGQLWRRYLHTLEPSPTVPQVLDGVLADEVRAAGLRVSDRRPIAGGRAEILLLDRFGS